MDFSVWPDNQRPFVDVATIVKECERWGWHAAYFPDHFMPNGPDDTPLSGDCFEAMTTLSALAALTETIRIGPLVASATYRHPAVFAKAMITLDHLSAGRVIVGIGAGWQDNEHASYGIDLGTIGERVSRFAEYVEVVDSLWSNERTTFHGTYYQLSDAPCDPKPLQRTPPILLGVRGAKRTMAVAARYASTWNAWTNPDDLRSLNATLDARCAALSRDPVTLRRSTQAVVTVSRDEKWLASRRERDVARASIIGTPDEVTEILRGYEAAGCDEFIVPMFFMGETARARETLALFNEDVVPNFQ